MYIQTNDLFSVVPPATTSSISSLLHSYTPSTKETVLNMALYPEPYYGDYNNPSIVFLTHNPGNSDLPSKGIGSAFGTLIRATPGTPADHYYKLAVVPNFPNPDTNRWIKRLGREVHAHFDGIQKFSRNPFIRDLIPYHSKRFGNIDMRICSGYLYKYFFPQVIKASFNSEIYSKINNKNIAPTTIIYARGKAWKNRNGLGAIGWDRIGRIYNYCYVYKADFNKIYKMEPVAMESFSKIITGHNVYIVVITPIRSGAPYGVYSIYRDLSSLIDLKNVIANYKTIKNPADPLYIDHNPEMTEFLDVFQ